MRRSPCEDGFQKAYANSFLKWSRERVEMNVISQCYLGWGKEQQVKTA